MKNRTEPFQGASGATPCWQRAVTGSNHNIQRAFITSRRTSENASSRSALTPAKQPWAEE